MITNSTITNVVIPVGELFGEHVILVQTKSRKKKNQKVTRLEMMDGQEEREILDGNPVNRATGHPSPVPC